MQEFFGHVECVKRNILVIRNSTTWVGEINQQVPDTLSFPPFNMLHLVVDCKRIVINNRGCQKIPIATAIKIGSRS